MPHFQHWRCVLYRALPVRMGDMRFRPLFCHLPHVSQNAQSAFQLWTANSSRGMASLSTTERFVNSHSSVWRRHKRQVRQTTQCVRHKWVIVSVTSDDTMKSWHLTQVTSSKTCTLKTMNWLHHGRRLGVWYVYDVTECLSGNACKQAKCPITNWHPSLFFFWAVDTWRCLGDSFEWSCIVLKLMEYESIVANHFVCVICEFPAFNSIMGVDWGRG